MAGDWIKVEHTTPDKPEVIRMASMLGIDPDAVTGKLIRLWVWADQNSVNGNALTVTFAFLDRYTFCPGFAEAMQKVGWLTENGEGLAFPGFDRHNGKTAKTRAETNRRVAKMRKSQPCNAESVTDVTQEPLPKPLPEKRREERVQQQLQQPAGATPPESVEASTSGILRLHPHCTQLDAEQWAERHNRNTTSGVRITPEIAVGWWEDRTRTDWQIVKGETAIPLATCQQVEADIVSFARTWAKYETQPRPGFRNANGSTGGYTQAKLDEIKSKAKGGF